MARQRYSRRAGAIYLMVGLLIVLSLFFGLVSTGAHRHSSVWRVSLVPSDQPESNIPPSVLESIGGPIFRSFSNFFNPQSTVAMDKVGIDVEMGYTSIRGETHSFVKSVMAGVILYEMRGVYVKPEVGRQRSLKLYDPESKSEGAIWIRPTINLRVFNGTPKFYSFKVNVKILRDGELVGEKQMRYEGFGAPPKKIVLDKVEIRGSTIMEIIEKRPKKVGVPTSSVQAETVQKSPWKTSRICFVADYEGVVVFEEEPDEPVYRRVENVQLGCFEFEQVDVGVFEIATNIESESKPLVEVVAASDAQGERTVVETRTHTVTIFSTVVEQVTVYKTVTVTRTVTAQARPGGSVGSTRLSGVYLTHPYGEFVFVGPWGGAKP